MELCGTHKCITMNSWYTQYTNISYNPICIRYNCIYHAMSQMLRNDSAFLHAWLTCTRHFHMCSSSCLRNAVERANGVYKNRLCLPCRLFFKAVSICQLSFPMIKTYQKMSKNACQGCCCISNEMQLQHSHMKKDLRLGFRAELLVEVVLVTSEIDGCGQNEELRHSVHQWMHLTLNLVSINEVLETLGPWRW